jgi:hypothetical protein
MHPSGEFVDAKVGQCSGEPVIISGRPGKSEGRRLHILLRPNDEYHLAGLRLREQHQTAEQEAPDLPLVLELVIALLTAIICWMAPIECVKLPKTAPTTLVPLAPEASLDTTGADAQVGLAQFCPCGPVRSGPRQGFTNVAAMARS